MIKEHIRYNANGYSYKIVKEWDGWQSIYRWNYDRNEYIPMIQASTIEKAKDWCDLQESINIVLKKLC